MRIFTLVAIAALMFTGTAQAATINVPADYSTIQAAIDAASNGDTVLVAPGTYYELIDFKGKAITVTSSGGAASTILDGNNSGPIVSFDSGEGNGSVLQGFTLTHGDTNDWGSAVHIQGASPEILDNRFVDNIEYSGYWGGAIGGGGGDAPLILRNYFTGNTCGSQFYDSVMGFIGGGSPVIADNVFVDNPCPAVLLEVPSSADAQAQVYNNTMVDNRYGLVIYLYGSTLDSVSNNLIAFNYDGGLEIAFNNGATMLNWSHNLVYGNSGDSTENYQGVVDQTGTDGNISVDPLLKDRANDDVHVLYGSPAIDAGDATVNQASASDFYGDARVSIGNPNGSSVVDIGAAEYYPPMVTATGGSLNAYPGVAATGILGSANADPAEPLIFSLLTKPQHGTVTVTDPSTGAFQYVSANRYVGQDAFTFRITDPFGTVSDIATERVTITDVEPGASAGYVTTVVDALATGQLSGTASYLGQVLNYAVVTRPQHGSVSLNSSTGQFAYSPQPGFVGSDSFTFQVVDPAGTASSAATESITVNDVAPSAVSATIRLSNSRLYHGVLHAKLSYGGQKLTYRIVSGASHGAVTVLDASRDTYTYQPALGYRGADSFTFQVVDQWGTASNVATVNFTVR